MGKLLFWLLLAVVAVFWFRAKTRKHMPPPSPKGPEVEDMVRCQICGVNLPRSEAILSRGRFYCCPEHREQDRG